MTQLTIRRIDESWVARAKQEARRRGTSMNTVLVEALGRGLGVDGVPPRRTDLDKYAGDSDFGPGWDAYLDRDLQRIDDELWN